MSRGSHRWLLHAMSLSQWIARIGGISRIMGQAMTTIERSITGTAPSGLRRRRSFARPAASSREVAD